MQDGQQPNEPGWVFRPGDQSTPTPTQVGENIPEAPAPPTPVTETPARPMLTPQMEMPEPIANPVVSQNFDSPISEAPTQDFDTGEIHAEWTASEYVANPKNKSWFSLLAAASIFVAAIVYVVTRDLISTSVTIILGILLGIFAARQPRTLQYRIDSKGIHIGQKFYEYAGFKSFSVAHEHAMAYISLMPLKRFMPPLAIHYDVQDEDKIVQTLADYLPFEEHKPDMVDSLTRRIRF